MKGVMKMKVAYLMILILCISVSIVGAKTRVFILSGQSNMVGVGEVKKLTKTLRVSHTITNSAIYVSVQGHGLRGPMQIAPGNTALTPENDGVENTFGPELGIGKVLRQYYLKDKLIFIKVAVGGTMLHDDPSYPDFHWLTSDDQPAPLMVAFFDKVQEAVGKITDVGYTIDGFIWMQGESDGDKIKSAVYSKKLTRFVELIRQRWPGIPFVYGMIHNENFVDANGIRKDEWPEGRRVQIEQYRAQSLISNCRCTDKTAGKDATVYQSTEDLYGYAHYNTAGMLNVGKYLGEAMVDKIKGVKNHGCAMQGASTIMNVLEAVTE
jgi:hypothetical protein